ncbi:unnamed protein product, partial [Ectocarpus sp. 12 AP-2014]
TRRLPRPLSTPPQHQRHVLSSAAAGSLPGGAALQEPAAAAAAAAVAEEEAVNIPEVKRVFREQLEETKRHALAGGGDARLERQHSRGKLSARERLDVLLDP